MTDFCDGLGSGGACGREYPHVRHLLSEPAITDYQRGYSAAIEQERARLRAAVEGLYRPGWPDINYRDVLALLEP